MDISIVDNTFSLALGPFGTVTLAVLVLLFGNFVKKRINFLERYCLPAPVIGGVIFSLVNLILNQTGLLDINLTSIYQNDFQFMFFTIVGFGASVSLLKVGGSKLVKYFFATGFLIVFQNIFGLLAAKFVGVSSAVGLIASGIPLAGGHGSVAAYGQMLEDMGHSGILVAGMSAATFGLIVGSILGGPISNRLITKNNLKRMDIDNSSSDIKQEVSSIINGDSKKPINVHAIIFHIGLIGVFMTLGNYFGNTVAKLMDISLPGFVGPMFLAFIVRNTNDKFNLFEFNQSILDKMSTISLSIFLSMAMISLKLWELLDLAIPLIIILAIVTTLTIIFIYFVVFRVLGKDYDAAVMCAGLVGHGLGATPTGIANMESVSEKHGTSKLAFLIVPIVGGFLQDMFIVPVTVFLINVFG